MTIGKEAATEGTLRQDARRNRDALVAAATEVFSEQGLDASLIEVARRASVGNATLYRHFPTRADLHAAVFAEAQETIHQLGRKAMLIEDGWVAFCSYLEQCCELAVTNRAYSDLMMVSTPGHHSPMEGWDRVEIPMRALIERAQRQGALQPGVTHEDVLMALFSVQMMIPASIEIAPRAWRRQLTFTLNGLHTNAPNEPADPTITSEQLHPIVQRLFLRDTE
ncbi:TetR/AcrR family transcriptional regulator [Pseudonocardia spinosispora]|uniref:TetR/AcrR family transcriptional regulator n=1 Tax=Pseudonocardia spinosispora TaxID=103441 RepID=UPI0003F99FAD|nr:TetR/AcrR family transcriptional regulator [Pseudonocardia spinosispora]